MELVADHMSEGDRRRSGLEPRARRGRDVARGVRHLVVFDGGEAVGVLSMRDIVRVWTTGRRHLGMTPGLKRRDQADRWTQGGRPGERTSCVTRRRPTKDAEMRRGSGQALKRVIFSTGSAALGTRWRRGRRK